MVELMFASVTLTDDHSPVNWLLTILNCLTDIIILYMIYTFASLFFDVSR